MPELYRAWLESAGYVAFRARSETEAEQILNCHNISLVMTSANFEGCVEIAKSSKRIQSGTKVLLQVASDKNPRAPKQLEGIPIIRELVGKKKLLTKVRDVLAR